MKSIVISGIGRCGKSLVTAGFILNFKNCGYFKPIGEKRKVGGRMIDEDVYLMKKIANISLSDYDICPGLDFPEVDIDIEKIKSAYQKAVENKDHIIIETDIVRGARNGLSSFEIADALNTKILLVIEEKDGWEDEMAFLKRQGEELIKGVVLNKVKNLDLVDKDAFLGTIPYTEGFSSVSCAQIQEALSANILAGNGGLLRQVENILVGAMTPKYAMPYLERIPNKTIITGGDRTDLILSVLTEDTSCIVLTGDIIPFPEVIEKAEIKKIPLLSVPWDTHTTLDKIETVIPKINPDNKARLSSIKEITNSLCKAVF
ncbi:TPA: hypothetical protein DCX16_02450 [bacterium]|nr:hypothetical protein [bacterium]